MFTADRYIAKQLLGTTLFAVTILSGVFLLGNIFKEARPLFVGQHPSASLIFQFLLNILPFSLMFTIPFSFLAAIMLVFGRLSADNEIISLRMSGRSLPRIALPVFLIALLLSGFCYFLNIHVAPRAKSNATNLLLAAVKDDPNKFLDPGVVQTQLDNKRIFVRARDGDTLYGLHIHDVNEDSAPNSYIYAEKALLHIDMEANQLQLRLDDATLETRDKHGTRTPINVAEVNPVLFDFDLYKKRRIRPSYMTNQEIRSHLKTHPELPADDRIPFLQQITHRQSFSLACFAFALIGIPLGLTARRRETSTGFALALGIGLVYFLFHIFAEESSSAGLLNTILYWLPNLLALLLGIYLFRRARRR